MPNILAIPLFMPYYMMASMSTQAFPGTFHCTLYITLSSCSPLSPMSRALLISVFTRFVILFRLYVSPGLYIGSSPGWLGSAGVLGSVENTSTAVSMNGCTYFLHHCWMDVIHPPMLLVWLYFLSHSDCQLGFVIKCRHITSY